MSVSPRRLVKEFIALTIATLFSVGAFGATHHYLVTNDDHSNAGGSHNSATFFSIASSGNLTEKANVPTGGFGWDALGSALTRVLVSKDVAGNCAYLAEYVIQGSTSRYAVTPVSIDTLKVVGHFKGSSSDVVTSSSSNMGLAMYGSYLYANFTGPQTIGTYRRRPGCKLKFMGDVSAKGLAGGTIIDMVARKNILVVSFSDGSIESFNTSSGMPVSNRDLQYSSDHWQNGGSPEGIDATSDGHFVIFGDGGGPAVSRAEVSDISSGKLTPTKVYTGLGTGETSINVWLSPDETMLYVSEFSSGQVSAASFNKKTGALVPKCESHVLRGYRVNWVGTYKLATKDTSGKGSTVYVAEPDTYIGAVDVMAKGGKCSLPENNFSPFYDHHTISMESIGIFPPRLF